MFTLHYRFMPVEEELGLLKEAVDAVDKDVIPTSLETKVRLFSLISEDLHVPIEAFSNDGVEICEVGKGAEATKPDSDFSNNFTDCKAVADTASSKGTPPLINGNTQIISNSGPHQPQSIVTQDEETKGSNKLLHANSDNEGSYHKDLC